MTDSLGVRQSPGILPPLSPTPRPALTPRPEDPTPTPVTPTPAGPDDRADITPPVAADRATDPETTDVAAAAERLETESADIPVDTDALADFRAGELSATPEARIAAAQEQVNTAQRTMPQNPDAAQAALEAAQVARAEMPEPTTPEQQEALATLDASIAKAETDLAAVRTDKAQDDALMDDLDDLDKHPLGARIREVAEGLLGAPGGMGVVSGEIGARLGIGTTALNITGGLGLRIAAEQTWGHGSSFNGRIELEASAEVKADVGFMEFSARYSHAMADGIHMADEKEVTEFARLAGNLALSYTEDGPDRGQAQEEFLSFIEGHRYSASSHAIEVEAKVEKGDEKLAGFEFSTSVTDNSYSGIDLDADGQIESGTWPWSTDETSARTDVQDTHVTGSLTAGHMEISVGHRHSAITYTDDPSLQGVPPRNMSYAEIAISPEVFATLRSNGGDLSATASAELAAAAGQIAAAWGHIGGASAFSEEAINRALEEAARSDNPLDTDRDGGAKIILGLQYEDGNLYPMIGFEYTYEFEEQAPVGAAVMGIEAGFEFSRRQRINIPIPVAVGS